MDDFALPMPEPLPVPPLADDLQMTLAHAKLIEESEQRKKQLLAVLAEVEQLRRAHTLEINSARELVATLSAARAIAEAGKRRADNQLKCVALAVCPILREYQLQATMFPEPDRTGVREQQLKNAREMLALLEPFEKC